AVDITVFPTGVGMNRKRVIKMTKLNGVPHRRGDEPIEDKTGFAGKGLGYVVPDTIRLEIGKTKNVMCKVKGVQFVGFFCEFIANFKIPDYLGLGKSVSRGYGAVEKIKSQNIPDET
ncbi:MAG TPA: hypothetical protein C5S50_03265, partial [Methanosarcinaceae archaeon]|nr:hypothetical protein [Methanosarcinaceae archaeon]